MGKLVLVTGGARSGKSSFAEQYVKNIGDDILYIATAVPFDEEMKLRVKKHREARPRHWETLEAYNNMDVRLKSKLKGKAAVMLDCVTIMTSNIMFEENRDWENLNIDEMLEIEQKVEVEMDKLLHAVKNSEIPFVLVTNELGMGIVPENALARLFRDVAGRVNQRLASAADEVYFCVSGIPMKIK